MQNFKDLYTELATTLKTKIPGIKWIDLWHNQVNFLSEEHPFPSPAVFLNFRIMQADDTGLRVQKVKMQVDCFVYYETFADTYHESWNQASALEFLNLLNDIQATLHASNGVNYSGMRRIGMNPVDTGDAGNTYQISFECTLMDYAAQVQYDDDTIDEMELERGGKPVVPPDENDYIIKM